MTAGPESANASKGYEESDKLLSVIIANYNYENYVGTAIASALAIDWPLVEIIVVDDGSTDGSRRIIEGFLPRGVTAHFLSNNGQVKAVEYGYQRSHGDMVLFLDSDDMVAPSIVREVMAAMKPGWSKVQFQMRVIDGKGNPTNHIFPRYRKGTTPNLIRQWSIVADSCTTPPNSGNVYSREFLEKIFPLEPDMDNFVDSYCLSTAPFLGDVFTVCKPLVFYRVHGRNDCAQSILDPSKIARDLKKHINRCEYSARIAARHGIVVKPNRWQYSVYSLSMRVASLRLVPGEHPLARDTVRRCLRDSLISFTRPQGMPPLLRFATFLWFLAVAIAPKPMARTLVSWRFVPGSRPGFIQRLIQAA